MDPILDVYVREPITDPVLDVCVREPESASDKERKKSGREKKRRAGERKKAREMCGGPGDWQRRA